MAHRSKRYKKEAQQVAEAPVTIEQAVDTIKKISAVKFDQSIECVVWLGIDPKMSDQNIRGSLSLPHGIGKQKRVIAFCEESEVEAAKAAGAVEAGCDELVKKVTDFPFTPGPGTWGSSARTVRPWRPCFA